LKILVSPSMLQLFINLTVWGLYNQIIEDGPETRDKPAHIHPARMFSNIMNPALGVFHYYKGRASDALGGRVPIVPAGRCLGGGSAINREFMSPTEVSSGMTRNYISDDVYSSCSVRLR